MIVMIVNQSAHQSAQMSETELLQAVRLLVDQSSPAMFLSQVSQAMKERAKGQGECSIWNEISFELENMSMLAEYNEDEDWGHTICTTEESN